MGFLRKPYPSSCSIPEPLLEEMRAEFEYWYPMGLRVSAKDLIQNHLTMSLYNHVEIWKDRPELWPRGMYCNGHILVDALKMSKSAGNFLLMLGCCEDYTADATRFALADAGDTLDDANFERAVANQAVNYLFVEEEWIQSVLGDGKGGTLRDGDYVFMDHAFLNEIDYLVEATKSDFDKMCYRDGLHRCWFDMIIARDLYRDWAARCEIPLHKHVVIRFISSLTVMMSPITPHWCEHIWSTLSEALAGEPMFMSFAKGVSSVCDASWPTPSTTYDKLVRKQYIFFRDVLKTARQAAMKSKVAGEKTAHVFIASSFDEKKKVVLNFLSSQCSADGEFPPDLLKTMKSFFEADPELKKDTKMLMQFGAFMRDDAKVRGPDALALEQPFEQKQLLLENKIYIQKALNLVDIQFYYIGEEGSPPPPKKVDSIIPGKPEFVFVSTSDFAK